VAGLTISKALRQSKKRASLDSTNLSVAVLGMAFFLTRQNSHSKLRLRAWLS
jgi:hypothetical protein